MNTVFHEFRSGKPHRPFFLITIFLFLCVTVSSWTNDGSAQSDEVIARVWLERSYRLMNNSPTVKPDWAASARAWLVAADFQNPGRDAIYLRARLILADFDPIEVNSNNQPQLQQYGKYRRSFDVLSESWSIPYPNTRRDIVDFEVRAQFWAALALRNKEYRTLVEQFYQWPQAYRYQSELLYAVSRAALYLGLKDEAIRLGKRGEALSDSATSLRYLDVNYGAALPAFRALLVAAGDGESIQTLAAARRSWGAENMDRALMPFLLSGVLDPNVLLSVSVQYSDFLESALEILSGPTFDPKAAVGNMDSFVELLRSSSLGNDLSLARRLQKSHNLNLRDVFEDSSGLLTADSNYDGYPEETITMISGRLVSRSIDENQDGSNEWIIDYNRNGEPLRIALAVQGGLMTVNYDNTAYPLVRSLSRNENSTTYDLSFNPGAFAWAPLELNEVFQFPRVPEWNEEDLWTAARRIIVEYHDEELWTAKALTVLAEGYPIWAEETRYPENRENEREWTRQLLYSDGLPVAGRLSYRNDPNDRSTRLWEVYERYEQGRLVGIAWAPGMSGSAAYLQDWALKGVLETQVWNFNDDSWMDVRRLMLPGGREDSKSLMIGEARSSDLLPWTVSDWAPWEY